MREGYRYDRDVRCLLVALLAASCSRAEPTIARDPAVGDATPTNTLEGRIAGKPWTARKVFVRRHLDQTMIYLCSSSRAPACDEEEPRGPEHAIFIHVWRPIVPGEAITERTKTVTVFHTSHSAPKRTFQLIVGEPQKGVVRGHLDFTAEDDSFLRGDFVASDCASWQHKRDDTERVNGVAWSKVPPKVLPADPVEGFLGGDRFTPQRVVLRDRRLVIYRKRPDAPCAEPDDDRIVIGLRDVKLGPVDPTTRLLRVRDVGGVYPFEGGRAAIELDAITPKEVRGRIFAALDDPAQSMIAGAFTATVCP
jgi:hypothetical protein